MRGVTVRRISPTRLFLTRLVSGVLNSPEFLILDRVNIAPLAPTDLSASVSVLTVSLVWTDHSDDETEFVILRKGTATGSFSEIATVPADSTSYSDTVPANGTYWYRVQAANTHGNSFGTKLVKVTVGS